jgi:hypothetical protein
MRTNRRSGVGRTIPARIRTRLKPEPLPDSSSAPSEDVARYIADMTTQLGSMASGARLDLLAYFLKMAHAECLAQISQAIGIEAD